MLIGRKRIEKKPFELQRSFDQFTLCAAHDLLKRSLTFITFFFFPLRRFIEASARRNSVSNWNTFFKRWTIFGLFSQLNLIPENEKFYKLLNNIHFFTSSASSITTHIRFDKCAWEEPPNSFDRLKNVRTYLRKCRREKSTFFEENNYIIEPRQMAKYFPFNVDALINGKSL